MNESRKFKGVGLLHDINARSYRLHKAALIYADNGRGKSSIVAVLRAAAVGSAAFREERRSIDGTNDPAVKLGFSNGEYAAASWNKQTPELSVFDGAFIDENVHTGGTVGPNHRKNLLHFALGAAAVMARKKEEEATAAANAATEQVKKFVGQLSGYLGGIALQAFGKLTLPADVDVVLSITYKVFVAGAWHVSPGDGEQSIVQHPFPRKGYTFSG